MLEGLVKATIAAANGAELPLANKKGGNKGRQAFDQEVEPLRLESGPRSSSSNGVTAANYGGGSLKSRRSIASHNILTAASISLSDDDDL